MESTMYALLAGFQNFGQTISRNVGSFLLPIFNVKLSTAPGFDCQYEHFWLLILICQCVLPLVTIPLTFFLIPKARLTGVITDEFGNVFPPPPLEDEEEDLEVNVDKDKEVEDRVEEMYGQFDTMVQLGPVPTSVDTPTPVYYSQ